MLPKKQKVKKKKTVSKARQKKVLYELIRQIIVLRDGEKCLRCHRTDTLAMSHIYPKGKHRRMELEPNNIKFLCFACHICWFHKHPLEAAEWLKTVISPERLKALKQRANSVDKSVFNFEAHKKYLEDEIIALTP